MSRTQAFLDEAERVGAPNYAPLPVVIARGEGVWVWDVDGRRYLDCISAYSSLNHGHRHPRIVAALVEQAGRLTLTSRAVHNDQMGAFLAELCALAGFEMALPMNTGAEAVETAIKLARKWGYRSKGVAHDRAEIVVCRNNFHGRTTTIVGFSSEEQYREDFGPFTPGFTLIDFGDLEALRAAFTPNTVAFLVEPIQAEAGIIMPPPGYLAAARALCRERNVLPRSIRNRHVRKVPRDSPASAAATISRPITLGMTGALQAAAPKAASQQRPPNPSENGVSPVSRESGVASDHFTPGANPARPLLPVGRPRSRQEEPRARRDARAAEARTEACERPGR